jgi:hypothetical protein
VAIVCRWLEGMVQKNASLRDKLYGGGGGGGGGGGPQRMSKLMAKGYAYRDKVEQVLVTGYSNQAVNNIMKGLLKRGVKALRVGYNSKMDEGSLTAAVQKLAKEADVQRYVGQSREGGGQDGNAAAAAKRQQLHALQDQAMDSADVICATCISAGSGMLVKRNFTHVLLDEATQATEVAALVPTVGFPARRVVLVGDHKQLPPTILSPRAEQEGLSESLFERLVRLGYPYTMMKVPGNSDRREPAHCEPRAGLFGFQRD